MSSLVSLQNRFPQFALSYPRLGQKMRLLPLGQFPTPVHFLPSLSKKLGFAEVYIKRDDQSGLAYGGNKVRKLEFYFAEAQKQKLQTLLTIGGDGSNHIAGVGFYARQAGFQCEAVCVPQPTSALVQKNLLFNLQNGVILHPIFSQYILPQAVCFRYFHLLLQGKKPYFIPIGGTSSLGVFAYVIAMFELVQQIEQGEIPCPKRIYCALGSAGTAAGLWLGIHLAGYAKKIQLCPVAVVPKPFCGPEYLHFYARQCNRFLRRIDRNVPFVALEYKDIVVLENQVGEGYGFFTKDGEDAQRLIHETEGIELEGTYTAKAFAGLLAQESLKKSKEPVLFWNTINSVPLWARCKNEDWKQLPLRLQRHFY